MMDLDISQLSIDAQQRIDGVCRDYESQMRSTDACDPASVLDMVSEQERPVLLFELLKLHAELDGDSTVLDRVLASCPNYAWVIDRFSGTVDVARGGIVAAPPGETVVQVDRDSVHLIVKHDGQVESHCLAIPGQYVVGRSQEVDVPIKASQVDQRHVCLILEHDRFVVVNLSSPASLSVAGQPVEMSEVDPASSFEIEGVTFGFRQSEKLLPTTLGAQHDQELEVEGFEIRQKLGQGSFGVVYDAIQQGTNKRFAIKSILPGGARAEKVKSLFMREISIVSQLKHPNIVSYHGFGIAEDRPYLILEYVEAADIDALVAQQPAHKQVRLCVGIAGKMLAALSHAHDMGIIHRDVKLANVLAGIHQSRLFVKLADFGLAKFFETAGFSGMTASDAVCGTIAFMSPEQLADSKYAEPDCDVYAVGVCLYRILTGKIPHHAASPAETIHKRMRELPTSADELNLNVTAELAAEIQRALHPDPARRFRSAEELATALKPFGL